MARVVYSALVQNLKGSVAGSTFQNNRYGFTMKSKGRSAIPRNQNQVLAKNIIGFLSAFWISLSDFNRAQWSAWAGFYPIYAKYNSLKPINGREYFMKANYYRMLFSFTAGNVLSSPGVTVPLLLQLIRVYSMIVVILILTSGRVLFPIPMTFICSCQIKLSQVGRVTF